MLTNERNERTRKKKAGENMAGKRGVLVSEKRRIRKALKRNV